MKKILFYTMIMTRGGAENTIANIANNLIKKFDVTIVTNIKHNCEYQLNEKIKYICLDTKDKRDKKKFLKILTKLSLNRTKKLNEVIQMERPDVIISFLPESNIRALSLKNDIPKIISIRNHPKSEFKYLTLLRDHYYRKANAIVVQDKAYIKYLNKDVKDRINVIPNFIPNVFFEDSKSLYEDNIIMTAVRLEKQKNVSLLINAFAKIHKEFNSYRLHIFGRGSLEKELQCQIKRLKMENFIILKGVTKNIKEEFSKAKVFVLPSNYEGMPNVVLEAMACGVPVIATDSTEVLHSIIDDGTNGYIIEKNDEKALQEKIKLLLSNKEKRLEMSKKAKESIKDFDEDKIMNLWENIVNKFF